MNATAFNTSLLPPGERTAAWDVRSRNDQDHATLVKAERPGNRPKDARRVASVVRDIIDDVPEATREAIDTGRDLYRRGAMAVARTGGENGALMLLAGTAAVAAASWLLFSRRRKRP